jgi:hypothetical protein
MRGEDCAFIDADRDAGRAGPALLGGETPFVHRILP